jgi:hypothetical protein
MATIAQRSITGSAAASTATMLLRSAATPAKAYTPASTQRGNHAGLEFRRAHPEDRPHKSSFATKAIGLDSFAALSVFNLLPKTVPALTV